MGKLNAITGKNGYTRKKPSCENNNYLAGGLENVGMQGF
jgi:hypothetical protein